MKPLSELEWLGVELALSRFFLSHPGRAMLLARLMRRAGVTVRTPCLVSGSTVNEASVKIYICHLREAMEDLGFTTRIETIKEAGYRISESGACEILARIQTAIDHLMAAA